MDRSEVAAFSWYRSSCRAPIRNTSAMTSAVSATNRSPNAHVAEELVPYLRDAIATSRCDPRRQDAEPHDRKPAHDGWRKSGRCAADHATQRSSDHDGDLRPTPSNAPSIREGASYRCAP